MKTLRLVLLSTAVVAAGCFEPIIRQAVDAGAPLSCADGFTACGADCVNLRFDNGHCGACETSCTATEACAGGRCYPRDCTTTDCSADQVCRAAACADRLCVDMMCPSGQACYLGQCFPKACGSVACPQDAYCINGVCLDPLCVGVTCPTGSSCVRGACVAGCMAGTTCTPTQPCRTGGRECPDGGCGVTGNSPPGTSCGTGQVCTSTGACERCDAGDSCSPGACLMGTTTCTTGSATCTTTGAVAPGTSCGTGLVCAPDAGCVACAAGDACDAGACLQGAIACDRGFEECRVVGPAPSGGACVGGVCDGDGGCAACTAGASCTPASGCFDGQLSCTGASPLCLQTTPRDAGTSCGTGRVCGPDAGCIDCAAGSSCDAGVCRVGSLACGGGVPTCGTAPAAAGSSCGAGQFCDGDGGCGACVAGVACNTSNPCELGQIDCSMGVPRCVGMGPKPDTAICRPAGANATCDPAVTCTGTSLGCPAATPAALGTACGSANAAACDAPDTCDGAGACIARVKPLNTTCRAAGANATCDPAEVCDGVSTTCPTNAFATSATACGSANATECDAADTCDGAGACIARVKPVNTTCRAAGANATCDPAEVCNGVSTTCPTNALAPSLTPCGSANTTECDAADSCDGSGACIARVKPINTTCRAAGADAVCDPAEVCDGASTSCPVNAFASSATPCGSASSTGCDLPDTCSGLGACVNRLQAAGFTCRAAGANATCNPAETCTGSSATCPADVLAPNGTNCGGTSSCQAGACLASCTAPDGSTVLHGGTWAGFPATSVACGGSCNRSVTLTCNNGMLTGGAAFNTCSVAPGTTWYADGDNDGFGDPGSSVVACSQPGGYVANNGDCNPGSGSVFPGSSSSTVCTSGSVFGNGCGVQGSMVRTCACGSCASSSACTVCFVDGNNAVSSGIDLCPGGVTPQSTATPPVGAIFDHCDVGGLNGPGIPVPSPPAWNGTSCVGRFQCTGGGYPGSPCGQPIWCPSGSYTFFYSRAYYY